MPVGIAYPRAVHRLRRQRACRLVPVRQALTSGRWLGISFVIIGVYLLADLNGISTSDSLASITPLWGRGCHPWPGRRWTGHHRRRGRCCVPGWITTSPQVKKFEAALTDYLGGRPARVLNSATAALEVALQLCGIGPGDGDHPSQTFFAAPNMIAKVGATPVFVDVELVSRNLDFDAVERAITSRTKAIMPTHFARITGDRLYAMAERYRRYGSSGCGAGHRVEAGAAGGSAGSAIPRFNHPNKKEHDRDRGAGLMLK